MKAIVTLAKGNDNVVIISKNNSDSAAIMLVTEHMSANDQGFLQVEKRVGLFKGKTEQIQKLAESLKAGDNFSEKVMPVKLVIKESTTPAYPGHEPKINPSTGEVVTSSGSAVYRQTLVVNETSPEMDVRLASDKVSVAAAVTADAGFSKINK